MGMFLQQFKQYLIIVLLGLMCTRCAAQTPELTKAPASIQAALFIKLLSFNKSISTGGKVTIFVLDEPKVSAVMKTGVGKSIGDSQLASVLDIKEAPSEPPTGLTAFYIGNPKKLSACLAYCREHKIQSMSGIPALFGKGVTLMVGLQNNKPKVLVDIKNGNKEGVEFKPAILKYATPVESE